MALAGVRRLVVQIKVIGQGNLMGKGIGGMLLRVAYHATSLYLYVCMSACLCLSLCLSLSLTLSLSLSLSLALVTLVFWEAEGRPAQVLCRGHSLSTALRPQPSPWFRVQGLGFRFGG